MPLEHITKEYIEELHLKATAEKLGLSLPDAAKRITECLAKTAYEKGVSQSEVYEAVHTLEYVQECARSLMKGGVSAIANLSEKDCLKSCSTVWFEGQCHPRFFPNSEEINENPDAFAKGLSTPDLAKFIRLASYLYYNFEGGGLSDNSFDALEYLLNKREKAKFRRRDEKAIGALPIERLRVKLPYSMGSLDKVKPGMTNLIKYLGKPLEWSVKEDGVSALIVFSNGQPEKIYSRGNGVVGGDVTFIRDYITLPSPKEFPNIVVRGELVMKTKIFQEKYSKAYTTPRSMVAAKVNSGFASPWLKDISFVAYEIIDFRSGDKPPKKDSFSILEYEGFETAVHGTFQKPTLFEVIEEYKLQRAASEYWIDGLVIAPLSKDQPKVAFKMLLEEQIRWTTVISVEWNPTRTGKLFPKVFYEAIFVDGRRFTHSSGYNAAHIQDWNLRKDSRVKVVISGDVIPIIQDVKEPLDPHKAPAGFSLPPESPRWQWQGKDIYLIDIEGNPIVRQKRILYFWKVLGASGIGEVRVQKFYDQGYQTIASITNLTPEKIQGILYPKSTKTITTGEKIYKSIHQTLSTVRFDRLIPAMGTIKGMGRKLVKDVLKYIPDLFIEPPSDLRKTLTMTKIRGVGDKRKEALEEGVPKVLEFLKSISSEDFKLALANEKARVIALATTPKNPRINQKSFVFTGFFGDIDYQLEDYIYDNAGDISSTVTSSTGAVIVKNITEISKKMQLASELKVPILTIPEFIREFEIPFEVEDEDILEGDE